MLSPSSAWYRLKTLDLYAINLYLVNSCKFVTSKSSGKNEVDIKSVYMMLSEFGLRSGKCML